MKDISVDAIKSLHPIKSGANESLSMGAFCSSSEIQGSGRPQAHLVQNVERKLIWENGMPVIRYQNVIKKEAITELTKHALSQPYEGEWDEAEQCYKIDPRFVGMTKAEVIEHRLVDKAASGDILAIEKIKDRLLGKPKQQIESKNLNVTYEDYLNELAREEGLVEDESTELDL